MKLLLVLSLLVLALVACGGDSGSSAPESTYQACSAVKDGKPYACAYKAGGALTLDSCQGLVADLGVAKGDVTGANSCDASLTIVECDYQHPQVGPVHLSFYAQESAVYAAFICKSSL